MGRVPRPARRAALRRRGLPPPSVELLRGDAHGERGAREHRRGLLLARVPVLRAARRARRRGRGGGFRNPRGGLPGERPLRAADGGGGLRAAGPARPGLDLRWPRPRVVDPLLRRIQPSAQPSLAVARLLAPARRRPALPHRAGGNRPGTLASDRPRRGDPRRPRAARPARRVRAPSGSLALDRLPPRFRRCRRDGQGGVRGLPRVALRDLLVVCGRDRLPPRRRGSSALEPLADRGRVRRLGGDLCRGVLGELERCTPVLARRPSPRRGGAGLARRLDRQIFRYAASQPRLVHADPARGREAGALRSQAADHPSHDGDLHRLPSRRRPHRRERRRRACRGKARHRYRMDGRPATCARAHDARPCGRFLRKRDAASRRPHGRREDLR